MTHDPTTGCLPRTYGSRRAENELLALEIPDLGGQFRHGLLRPSGIGNGRNSEVFRSLLLASTASGHPDP